MRARGVAVADGGDIDALLDALLEERATASVGVQTEHHATLQARAVGGGGATGPGGVPKADVARLLEFADKLTRERDDLKAQLEISEEARAELVETTGAAMTRAKALAMELQEKERLYTLLDRQCASLERALRGTTATAKKKGLGDR